MQILSSCELLSFPWDSHLRHELEVRRFWWNQGSLHVSPHLDFFCFFLRFVLGLFMPLLTGNSSQTGKRERCNMTHGKGYHAQESYTRHRVRRQPRCKASGWANRLGHIYELFCCERKHAIHSPASTAPLSTLTRCGAELSHEETSNDNHQLVWSLTKLLDKNISICVWQCSITIKL